MAPEEFDAKVDSIVRACIGGAIDTAQAVWNLLLVLTSGRES